MKIYAQKSAYSVYMNKLKKRCQYLPCPRKQRFRRAGYRTMTVMTVAADFHRSFPALCELQLRRILFNFHALANQYEFCRKKTGTTLRPAVRVQCSGFAKQNELPLGQFKERWTYFSPCRKRQGEKYLARQEGFEPPTYWFVASHSIQLSYWRIFNIASIFGH